MDPESVAEVTVRAEMEGQAIINVLHYAWTGLNPPVLPMPTALQFANSFRETWRGLILANICAAYMVNFYDVVEIFDRTVDAGSSDPVYGLSGSLAGGAAADAGGVAAAPLPTTSTISVKKHTPVIGRSYRGSLRLSGFQESEVTVNRIQDVPLARLSFDLAALYTVVDPGLATASLQLVVFSRKSYFGPDAFPNPGLRPRSQATPVSLLKVNPYVGIQGSRRQRMGGA